MPALHVVVRGQVQGVGFRWFVRERARGVGVRGWVRNLPDGAVEVAAEGEAGAIAALRQALARGPLGARVDEVVDVGGAPQPNIGDAFSILR